MALTWPGAAGEDSAGTGPNGAGLPSSRLALGPGGGLAQTSPLCEADRAAGPPPGSARGAGPSLPPTLPTVGQALPGIPAGLWPFFLPSPRPFSCRAPWRAPPPPLPSIRRWPSSPSTMVGGWGECPADPQQLVPDPGLQSSSWRQWGGDSRGQMQTGRRPAPRGSSWGVGTGLPSGVWRLRAPPLDRGLCQLHPSLTGGSGWSGMCVRRWVCRRGRCDVGVTDDTPAHSPGAVRAPRPGGQHGPRGVEGCGRALTSSLRQLRR